MRVIVESKEKTCKMKDLIDFGIDWRVEINVVKILLDNYF